MSCRSALFKILNISEDCYSDRSSCREAGKSFSIKRSKEKSYCTIKVDSCLITSGAEQKCDYIIVECESNLFHFIELKGSDIGTAAKQIINTILKIQKKYKAAGKELTSSNIAIHIVCNLSSTPEQNNIIITLSLFLRLPPFPNYSRCNKSYYYKKSYC